MVSEKAEPWSISELVDIRALDNIVIKDSYPTPLESEVIAHLPGCTHISALDAMSFLYQWRVHPDYHKLTTVVSHRGQVTFLSPCHGLRE